MHPGTIRLEAAINVRLEAAINVMRWGNHWRLTEGAEELADLLGIPYATLQQNWSEDVAGICKALIGPHGYAVYRMLKIKRGTP